MKNYGQHIDETDFARLSNFVYSNFGINLSAEKKDLLQKKLQKRLFELRIYRFTDYCEYLFSNRNEDREVIKILNLI